MLYGNKQNEREIFQLRLLKLAGGTLLNKKPTCETPYKSEKVPNLTCKLYLKLWLLNCPWVGGGMIYRRFSCRYRVSPNCGFPKISK